MFLCGIWNQALWLKPDDQFCTEMLTQALIDECRHGTDQKNDGRCTQVLV